MGLFGSRTPPTQPARPSSRVIPTLDPDFYESIHTRLTRNGGSDSSTEIAYGVGNAIFNTGLKYLRGIYDNKAAKDFEALYGERELGDRGAADRMIDFLVSRDASIQTGEGGWLGTLVHRLDDVLSRPA